MAWITIALAFMVAILTTYLVSLYERVEQLEARLRINRDVVDRLLDRSDTDRLLIIEMGHLIDSLEKNRTDK